MQRSQTTGFYDTFAQGQAVACIYAGSSSDSFLLTGLACVCSVGEREAGPWRREGRSLCGQTGQSHPEGWVLRQQKRKTHLFSLLRTRWNVMVWSQKDQGGEYPRGKDQRKRLRERGKAESGSPLSPPTLWSWLRICGWTCPGCVGCSEPYRPHELNPREVVDLPLRFPDPAVELLR